MQRIIIFALIGVAAIAGLIFVIQPRSSLNRNEPVVREVESLWPAKSIDAYSRDATAIIIGKFVRRNPKTIEANGSITNSYTFQVQKTLKGDFRPGQEIQLVESAGSTDNARVSDSDRIVYSDTKRQLLFLGTDERQRLGVYAGPNGQYQLDEQDVATDNERKAVKLAELERAISEALKKK